MLTLQRKSNFNLASLSTQDKPVEELIKKEWLLTNGRGGYASSTIVCCNTRRYHGLLIGSLNPPVERVMALSSCLEKVIIGEKVFDLSTFEFSDRFLPLGHQHIRQFRQDVGVHADYEFNGVRLTKSIYMLKGSDTVCLVYDFTSLNEPVSLTVHPFIALRDFHSIQKSSASFYARQNGDNLVIGHQRGENGEIFIYSPNADFERDEQWWYNFVYRIDKERGQEFTEDLWMPGVYKCSVESPMKVVFWAHLGDCNEMQRAVERDIEDVVEDLYKAQQNLISTAKTKDKMLGKLCVAADAFITMRETSKGVGTTILAGYPWFADWGRDALISLKGLLIETGRIDEARSVLVTFADVADDGMIPNCFDDSGRGVHFNSVDASLWFVSASFEYLKATGDLATFTQRFLPIIRWIMDSYQKGTRFNIHADSDGLITCGNAQTQLTWMDAKFDGIVFTPRYGKAVEINALWYNCLCLLTQFYKERDIKVSGAYQSLAEKVRESFCKEFWNEDRGYLNDCVLPDGTIDENLRPNQIFAISSEFSPLTIERQRAVVDVVEQKLLTPYGLRTLAAEDKGYHGIYTGNQRYRDEAYHQGTVWPYLIGAFIESYLKVNKFSKKSRKKAAEYIEPLLRHFAEDGCLNQVSEIFDGDMPHEPKGCMAQAWSIAELIRAYKLINE